GLEEIAGDRVVVLRVDGDADAVDPADERAMVAERLGADLGCDRPAAIPVPVDHRAQGDVPLRGVLERVEAAEIPDADDRRAQPAHVSPMSAGSTATTAIRAS